MKFSLVDGKKVEAQPGLLGFCPGCGRATIAKCGHINTPHWAHKGQRVCDPWWENETEWHRNWKGHFPIEWQEVVHSAFNEEKHFADVKTNHGWVLEFQHSEIDPTEREARNKFYSKITWVVDGLRRKKDQADFKKELNEIGIAENEPFYRRIFTVQHRKSALIRDWGNGDAPVFFDFSEEHVLWCLLPKIPGGNVYVVECSRRNFIKFHSVHLKEDLLTRELDTLRMVAMAHSGHLGN